MLRASLRSRGEQLGVLTVSRLSPFLIWDCRNNAGSWAYGNFHEASKVRDWHLYPGCRVFALDDVSTQVNGGAAYSEIWLSGTLCPNQEDAAPSTPRCYEGWCIELSGGEGFDLEELKVFSVYDTMSEEFGRVDIRYPQHGGPVTLLVRVVGFRDYLHPIRNWGCSLDDISVYQPPVGQKIKRILDI